MERNRTLAEDFKKVKTRIFLDNKLFDFARKLKVGDKGNLDLSGIIRMERKTLDDAIIKTFKVTGAKLLQKTRID